MSLKPSYICVKKLYLKFTHIEGMQQMHTYALNYFNRGTVDCTKTENGSLKRKGWT